MRDRQGFILLADSLFLKKEDITLMADKEVLKPIEIDNPDTGKKYTLTFTRETVKEAEDNGFIVNEIDQYPLTRIPELFYYAFLANHSDVTKAETDEILEAIGGIADMPEGLLRRLASLYGNAFKSLTVNPRIKVKF